MESVKGDAPLQGVGAAGSSGITGGGDLEVEQVMSEVHIGCPPNHLGLHISYFTVSIPRRNEPIGVSLNAMKGKNYETDEDGDLIVARRSDSHSVTIRIQHNITSSIPLVGLQVWKAELVLADFVLHKMFEWSNSDGIVAIELGCGTGLVGVLLAIGANTVFITGLLWLLITSAFLLVYIYIAFGIFHPKASVRVRELDWNQPWPPHTILDSKSQESYSWSSTEVEELQRATLLLAADVIYSNDLTDAFFNVLGSIMSNYPDKVLYLALEKRYNFTIDDLDAVANGYSHFLSYIKDEEEEVGLETEPSCPFVGRLVNIEEIPQYVMEYDRGKDVEIWEIRCAKSKHPLNK